MAAGDPIRTTDELYRRMRRGNATERGSGEISGQDIYDRFIRPGEERAAQSVLGSLRQSGAGSRALQEGMNEATARRMGFSGTALEQSMKDSLDSQMAARQADAYRGAQQKLQQMSRDPSRFDVLRRAGEAYGQKLNQDTAVNTAWAGVDGAIGTSLMAAGGPWAGLGAAISAIGAGRSAGTGIALGARGEEGAKRFSPTNIDSMDLGKLASGLQGQGGVQGQRAVGFQGGGRGYGSIYRQALDDEYNSGGGWG